MRKNQCVLKRRNILLIKLPCHMTYLLLLCYKIKTFWSLKRPAYCPESTVEIIIKDFSNILLNWALNTWKVLFNQINFRCAFKDSKNMYFATRRDCGIKYLGKFNKIILTILIKTFIVFFLRIATAYRFQRETESPNTQEILQENVHSDTGWYRKQGCF